MNVNIFVKCIKAFSNRIDTLQKLTIFSFIFLFILLYRFLM